MQLTAVRKVSCLFKLYKSLNCEYCNITYREEEWDFYLKNWGCFIFFLTDLLSHLTINSECTWRYSNFWVYIWFDYIYYRHEEAFQIFFFCHVCHLILPYTLNNVRSMVFYILKCKFLISFIFFLLWKRKVAAQKTEFLCWITNPKHTAVHPQFTWNKYNKTNITVYGHFLPSFLSLPPFSSLLILFSTEVFMWNKLLNSCSSLSAVTCVLPHLVHPLICHVILISTRLIFPLYPTVRRAPLHLYAPFLFFSFLFTFPYVSLSPLFSTLASPLFVLLFNPHLCLLCSRPCLHLKSPLSPLHNPHRLITQ